MIAVGPRSWAASGRCHNPAVPIEEPVSFERRGLPAAFIQMQGCAADTDAQVVRILPRDHRRGGRGSQGLALLANIA